jgi:hemerythrin superfamily protein
MRSLLKLSKKYLFAPKNMNLLRFGLYKPFATNDQNDRNKKDPDSFKDSKDNLRYASKIDEMQQQQQQQRNYKDQMQQDRPQDYKQQTEDSQSYMDENTYKDMPSALNESIKNMNKPIEDLLIADHKSTMAFIDEFEKADNDDDALRWLRQFIWDLARHSIAEEIILYPMYKDRIPNGGNLWNKSLEEHRRLKVLLAEIEQTKDLSKIRSKMKEVRDVLLKHTDMEENEIFPEFKKYYSESDRITAGNKFLRRKLIVPTRPHPHVPDSIPTVESLIGLFVAPIDKFRDIFGARFPDQDTVDKIKQDNANINK